jgi:hypothetical protein
LSRLEDMYAGNDDLPNLAEKTKLALQKKVNDISVVKFAEEWKRVFKGFAQKVRLMKTIS